MFRLLVAIPCDESKYRVFYELLTCLEYASKEIIKNFNERCHFEWFAILVDVTFEANFV